MSSFSPLIIKPASTYILNIDKSSDNLSSIELSVNYMSEAEIKNLMSDFLINVFDTSAVIRRSTAIILASICTSNRQAAVFLPW